MKTKAKATFDIQGSGEGEIKLIKQMRGKRKVITTITGLLNYGVPLKDVCKSLGKKMATGASVSNDEQLGEVIIVQGDIDEGGKFLEFVESDLSQYKITKDKVVVV